MSRIRMGVIGCGGIAQIQHLPHLVELRDECEIAGLCDLSRELLTHVGDAYGVPPERRHVDYRELVERADIDAVIVCTTGSHAPAAIAAAEAGKHILVEKPVCYTVAEAEAMADAADRAGVVYQAAYMKRYDPAFRFAQRRVAAMDDVRFIQVNHLHPDNALHLATFDYHVPSDLPPEVIEAGRAESDRLVAEALGRDRVDAATLSAFGAINGSMIHDIGNLHGMFGSPRRVVSTDIWADGVALTTVLEYDGGARAVCSWIDLPELFSFEETLAVYGSRDRVIASFPTGWSRGVPSDVTVQWIDAEGHPAATTRSWQANPFKLELEHFATCIRRGEQPLTPGREAIEHVALVRDIVLAHLETVS
ncbi:MAG: Gfo/Idh/MocA family oxidoreductase [Chloroflexota bacterium]|nr:Gfo/Idh/MocA family oxidoreductase [Chloroflexota bacterium]